MKGYAKLGLLMGDFPEVAALRRFSALSAQNLLYLQAEIRQLEVDLRKYAEEDETSQHPDRKVYSVDWFALKDSCKETADEGNDGRQWQTILEIREKLERYEIALLRHRALNKMTRPISRDLAFLNRWMQRTDMGNVYFHGEDRSTWSNEEWRHDLVSLGVLGADDIFFRWISQILGKIKPTIQTNVQEPRQDEHLAGTLVYGEATILHLTRAVATILACVLPVASIALLYTVQSMSKRIGIIAVFTAMFSFTLVLTITAGMADIFAATAAYAAVQVVFIGTTGQANFTLPAGTGS
ncbi:hypothetical protein LSUE1_G004823 [Lachnellula suecica]|uniref:DUF6594 domain-containing protein n=1 Tax=Lachnellula suecica TaxID=602035 RepID=A0A8T9CD35_9HELO|nr:hypothetical protein LSUE1_G004823 [Lachnellula suecica]